MGQAKRKREAGKNEYWYHGTNQHFESWGKPPIESKYKKELFPHSFISLSKDRVLSADAGKTANGLCRSLLKGEAKVLDLRKSSNESKIHWERVINSPMGRGHALIRNFPGWVKACTSGEVLRMHTDDPVFGEKMERVIRIFRDPLSPIKERAMAHLIGQNFTREWIETVISPAKQAGYDAVICPEIDRMRLSGAKPCTNLHVFNPLVLTEPEWISTPDESLMQEELTVMEDLGVSDYEDAVRLSTEYWSLFTS